MEKTLTLEEFYEKKLGRSPSFLTKEIGHFNVFRSHNLVGERARLVPYSRKDYYKISLIKGRNRYHYADKTVEVPEHTLFFGNPMIPYSYEPLEEEQQGQYCIFTDAFFNHYGNIKEYPVFKPGGNPVFILNAEQFEEIKQIYLRMEKEIETDYTYKYDVLRNLVFELIHTAMKLQPATFTLYKDTGANTRITSMFTELLERQFPIETPNQHMKLRTPTDFAEHLSVHTNHLNRAIRSISGKTTTKSIAERILQEARILLKQTDWTVAEIAYCLGFEESSHFISFFRKNMLITPKRFRE
jgi:AraC family transcriptional regulator, transcriptional activator of pobA